MLQLYSIALAIFIPFISKICMTKTTSQDTYAFVGNIILSHEPTFINDQDNNIVQKQTKNPSSCSLNFRSFMNEFDEKKIVFTLLNYLCTTPKIDDPLFDTCTLKTLPCISNPQNQRATLLEQLPVITHWGTAEAAILLAFPCKNILDIQRKQKLISFFANDELLNNLAINLTIIKNNNKIFLELFHNENNEQLHQLINNFYYTKNSLNESFFKLCFLQGCQKFYEEPWFAPLRIFWRMFFINALEKGEQLFNEKILPIQWRTSIVRTKEAEKNLNTFFFVMRVIDEIHNVGARIFVEKFISTKDAQKHVLIYMNNIVYSSKLIVKSIQKISKILDLHDAPKELTKIIHNFLATKEMTDFINCSNNVNKIIKNSFFEIVHMLVAYKKLEKCKSMIIRMLQWVGMIDVLQATANLCKQENYCIVQFNTDNGLQVNFKNMRYPIRQTNNLVANSFMLTQPNNIHMIISGPNGIGKSIFLQSVVLNCIFAQAFGIAAAESVYIPLFDFIETYFNIRENTSQQLSTHMAEIQRLTTICQRIKENKKGCSLIVMDEPLKGTIEQIGGTQLYQQLRQIAENQNTIIVVATHFHQPTTLINENKGFQNYYMQIIEEIKGKFLRKFTLVPGEHPWWFNDSEKRDRFLTWIAEQTLNINPSPQNTEAPH